MNLLHRNLDLISVEAWTILCLRQFSCKRLSWIQPLNCEEGSTLSCFRYSIVCSKHGQRNPLHPVLLLLINQHSQVLFHAGIHSFSLADRLRMECC